MISLVNKLNLTVDCKYPELYNGSYNIQSKLPVFFFFGPPKFLSSSAKTKSFCLIILSNGSGGHKLMSLLCGILSKRGFGVATKETSYNGAIIEVTWQLYQRTVVVKVNKSLRTTVRRLQRRRRLTLGTLPKN